MDRKDMAEHIEVLSALHNATVRTEQAATAQPQQQQQQQQNDELLHHEQPDEQQEMDIEVELPFEDDQHEPRVQWVDGEQHEEQQQQQSADADDYDDDDY
jgi:hypothetical protein